MTPSHLLPNHSALINNLHAAETAYQRSPSAALVLNKATARLAIAQASTYNQEKHFFITEAITLLEIANSELDRNEEYTVLAPRFAVTMAEGYLALYHLEPKSMYLVICRQILAPWGHIPNPEIYGLLVQIYALSEKPALARHWLTKLKQLDPAMHAQISTLTHIVKHI